MADTNIPFLNNVDPTTTGTFNSSVVATKDLRDLSLFLVAPTTTGSAADTVDLILQESDQRDFTDAHRIRTVTLTKPDGTVATAFDQLLGGVTSPNAILQQKFNLKDNNVNSFLRVQYTVAGTATSFTDLTVLLSANKKV